MLRRERFGSPPTYVEQALSLLAMIACAAALLGIIAGVLVGAYSAIKGTPAGAMLGLMMVVQGIGGLIVAAFIAFPWEVLRRLRQIVERLDRVPAAAPSATPAIADQPPPPPPPPSPAPASAPIPADVEYHPPPRRTTSEVGTTVRIRYRRPGGEVRERDFRGKSIEFVAAQAERQGYEVLDVVEI